MKAISLKVRKGKEIEKNRQKTFHQQKSFAVIKI